MVLRVSVLLLVATTSAALADGCFLPGEDPSSRNASSSAQKAVVFRDGPDEVLLLETTYQGPSRGFAWVVPVPSVPSEVFLANRDIMTRLFSITAPRVRQELPSQRRRWATGSAGTADAAPAGPSVTVHARMEVGDYDAAVLSGRGGDPLLAWLHDNGYRVPSEARGVLGEYAAREWAFVALRMLDRIAEERPTVQDPEPLGIRFATDTLCFPLTVSRISAPEQTSLALVVVDSAPVDCATLPVRRVGTLARKETYGDTRRRLTRTADGGPALLLEYQGRAAALSDPLPYRADSSDRRGGELRSLHVTRFFGLIGREQMTDLEFRGASSRGADYAVLVTERWPWALSTWGGRALRFGGLASFVVLTWLAVRLTRKPIPRLRREVLLPCLIVFNIVACACLNAALQTVERTVGEDCSARHGAAESLSASVRAFEAAVGCYPARLEDLSAESCPLVGLDRSGNRVTLEPRNWPPEGEGAFRAIDPGSEVRYDVLSTRLVSSTEPTTRVRAVRASGRRGGPVRIDVGH